MARTTPSPRISGGFIRIPVADMLAAWWATHKRPGGATDFRCWLATHEMVARRREAGESLGGTPRYTIRELAALCGIGERRAREAVGRLVGDGLLGWAKDGGAIEFPAERGPVISSVGPDTSVRGPDIAASLPGPSGSLSIPRRILRHLTATQARPAMLAVAISACLRCLSRREDGWRSTGRFKSSWVADTFAVDLRAVKAARAELIAAGWLVAQGEERDAGDQRARNAHGRAYRVALDWASRAVGRTVAQSGAGVEHVADRHPDTQSTCRETTPPDLLPGSPSGKNLNPEPGPARPTGGSPEREEGGKATIEVPAWDRTLRRFVVTKVAQTIGNCLPTPPTEAIPKQFPSNPGPPPPSLRSPRLGHVEGSPKVKPCYSDKVTPLDLTTAPQGPLPAPRLGHLIPADLTDTGRTLEIYRQAVAAGLAAQSEAGRLAFVSLIEHARAIGAGNPCGLAASLMRGGRWERVTGEDEDRARRRLREWDRDGTVGGWMRECGKKKVGGVTEKWDVMKDFSFDVNT